MTSSNDSSSTRRMNVLCVGSKKGGAGKTTFAHNFAAAAGEAGWKVLLVDIDSQCPSLTAFNAEPIPGKTLAEALVEGRNRPIVPAAEVVLHEVAPNVDLLATWHDHLEEAELELAKQQAHSLDAMVRVLAQLQDDYDLAVIDTPPEIGGLQEIAVVASDAAVAVARPNSLDLPPAMYFVEQVNKLGGTRIAPNLRFLGLAWSEYDPKAEETGFMEEWLSQNEPTLPVFNARIPTSRLSSKGVALGQPSVLAYPNTAFATAYKTLTAEVLRHLVEETNPPEASIVATEYTGLTAVAQ